MRFRAGPHLPGPPLPPPPFPTLGEEGEQQEDLGGFRSGGPTCPPPGCAMKNGGHVGPPLRLLSPSIPSLPARGEGRGRERGVGGVRAQSFSTLSRYCSAAGSSDWASQKRASLRISFRRLSRPSRMR